MFVMIDNDFRFRGQTKVKKEVLGAIKSHTDFDITNIKNTLNALPIKPAGFMYVVDIKATIVTITIGTLHNVKHKKIHPGGFIVSVTDMGNCVDAKMMITGDVHIPVYTIRNGNVTLNGRTDYKTMIEYYTTSKEFMYANDIETVRPNTPIKTNKNIIKDAILSISSDTYGNVCDKFKVAVRGNPEIAMLHSSGDYNQTRFDYKSYPIITSSSREVCDVSLKDILDSIDAYTTMSIKKVSENKIHLTLIRCSNTRNPMIYSTAIENQYNYSIKDAIKNDMMEYDNLAEFYLPALKEYYDNIEKRLNEGE